jgi:hypothetical protein
MPYGVIGKIGGARPGDYMVGVGRENYDGEYIGMITAIKCSVK